MNSINSEFRTNTVAQELTPAVSSGIRWGLNLVGAWPPPPNWSLGDWKMEIRAVAVASALHALGDYDNTRAVPLAGYIRQRVQSRTVTRYRQECQYARNTITDEPEFMAEAEGTTTISGGVLESLVWALDRLEPPERWLLQQIYWHHQTEASIAAELELSQPAINKRKRQALDRLRLALGEEERSGRPAIFHAQQK